MADIKTKETPVVKNKSLKRDYIHAVGRRRAAVARVRFYAAPKGEVIWGEQKANKGTIIINEKLASEYFSGDVARKKYEEPLHSANFLEKAIVTISVSGGGKNGQLDAVVLGISRAIAKFDKEKYYKMLRKKGLLTRDARVRERRKVGTGGKARRKKQSPKR